MAFGDYLIKAGSYVIPEEYILTESYKVTPDQRQDVDSYRDLNQDLHRNVSSHYKSIVEISTRKNLTESQFRSLLSGIRGEFKSVKERKIKIHYWNAETGSYGSGDFYWVQPNITILRIENHHGTRVPIYDSLTLRFIEY